MSTDINAVIPFPVIGMAVDLLENRRVFVGESMGSIGIAFVRPSYSDNEQSVFGKAVREQHVGGIALVQVMISREAAEALYRLLVDLLEPPMTAPPHQPSAEGKL